MLRDWLCGLLPTAGHPALFYPAENHSSVLVPAPSLLYKVGKCRSRTTKKRQDERERPWQKRKLERKERRRKKQEQGTAKEERQRESLG
ncbi:hypothetical protein Q8A73_000272 [Channa argus]|nr:hypothetical protein Q8A73_000272 [Channa argus]